MIGEINIIRERQKERVREWERKREGGKGTERERRIVREKRTHKNRINTRKSGIFKLPLNCYPLQRSAIEVFYLHCGQSDLIRDGHHGQLKLPIDDECFQC